MKLSYILMVIIAAFFLLYGSCVAQVSVIHFNSEWNTDNSFDINVLKDCDLDSVIICHSPKLQEKYKIKSVPTVIIFDDGEEVVRFEGNIMLELDANKKDIQKEIDKIYLAKFE
jgi:hypothetical protein